MAYATPPAWEHGDIPTAALMNRYRDALNEIKAVLDVSPHNAAAPIYPGADEDEAEWQIVHLNRYLVYPDEATLYDPTNEENSASLPKPAAGVKGVYDLDTVAWLAYGMTYVVKGCAWVIEDWEA